MSSSVYQSSKTNVHVLIILCSVLIIGVTAYLTNNYFAVHFPDGMSSSSACDINSFLNCDAATLSPLSNIFGVPISFFGLLIGIFALFGYLFNSPNYEGTLYGILTLNLAGCIILFFYSLISLGTLCPFCTLYYIFSGLLWFVFHKNVSTKAPHPAHLSVIGLIFIATSSGIYAYVDSKSSGSEKLAKSLISQYDNLEDLGHPENPSNYRLSSATKDFEGAPLHISKFSDFQCPGCKVMSDQLHKIERTYPGKVNIQYFFYPLDTECNPNMQRPLHNLACKAAYLSTCLPEKFPEIHDKIFANQQDLSSKWLKNQAKEYGVLECMNSEQTKKKVVTMIEQAQKFNIQSTPSILLNGKKIEGVLPFNQMRILLDELLERSN